MPVRLSTARVAGAGPMPMQRRLDADRRPADQPADRRRPCAITAPADASISAAPPSTMPLALPAVTLPSFLKAGGSFASPSEVVFGPHVVVPEDQSRRPCGS